MGFASETKLISTFAFHYIASLSPFNIMFAIRTFFEICLGGKVDKCLILFLLDSLFACQIWMWFLLTLYAVNKIAQFALYLKVLFLENITICTIGGWALSNVFCCLDCFLEAKHIKSYLKV